MQKYFDDLSGEEKRAWRVNRKVEIEMELRVLRPTLKQCPSSRIAISYCRSRYPILKAELAWLYQKLGVNNEKKI